MANTSDDGLLRALGFQEPLTSAGASVQTAVVTIKMLHVGNKGMTQSVFRQLLSEPVWEPRSRTLRGELLGFVNYFWQGCGMEGPHLHVIWRRGQELRRTCVSERDGEAEHRVYAHNLHNLLKWIGEVGILRAALNGTRPAVERTERGTYSKVRHWTRYVEYDSDPIGNRCFVWHDVRALYPNPDEEAELARLALARPAEAERHRAYHAQRSVEPRARLVALHAAIARKIESCSENVEAGSVGVADLDALERIEAGIVEEKRVYDAAWAEVLLQIRAVDHLFIAV
jgi:hypothetical protein